MFYELYRPMHCAVQGEASIVEALLGAGGDANMQDKKGWTALHHTVTNKHDPMGIFELLLQAGANMSQLNGQGMTALMLVACEDSALDVVWALIHRDPTQLSLQS